MITRKSKHEYLVTLPISLEKDAVNELKEWCSNFLGSGGKGTGKRWRYGWTASTSNNFYFVTESDALMFSMVCP